MKTIDVAPLAGNYVLAVSGGVDSMVLLDLLAAMPDLALTVAHFDHGIRADSDQDRKFVQRVAQSYGLPFEYQEGHLGAGASEDTARQARYAFLRATMKAASAEGIITAHHQDDLLETAILNMLRGTGRRGLTSLRSTQGMVRPLLAVPKDEIVGYAEFNNILWREDRTNQDQSYLRNYVRLSMLPRFTELARTKLLRILDQTRRINDEIDKELAYILTAQGRPDRIDRRWFMRQTHAISREIIAAWLRKNNLNSFDRQMLERLTVQAKTLRPGSRASVQRGLVIHIGSDYLALNISER